MSATNPIIPPGSPLQRAHPQRNPKLVVTVFVILAVHVLLLSGLLIQGCKRDDKTATGAQESLTNGGAGLPPLPAAPSPGELVRSTAPSDSGAAIAARPAPMPIPPAPAEQTGSVIVATEPSPMTTVRAPEPSASASHNHAGLHSPAPSTPTGIGDGSLTVYVVKAGDNLTKIAKAHGTTVKAIREASALKTDRILVGQKLKIPKGTSGAVAAQEVVPTASAAK